MSADMPLIDIRPDHWEIVRSILQKHVPQHEVWAFGSRAKWNAKEYSDLDLAIITDKPLSLDVSASLSDDFSESDLPWKVDVVDWAATSESFREIIERDKVVVQYESRDLGVANEWRVVTVNEIAAPTRNALVGGPFGSNLVSADYVDQGVPVIRGQNLGGRWVAGDFAYVSHAKADSLSGNIACPSDIVFTQRGTLGQVGLVPDGKFDRYLVSQSQMKLTVDRRIADPVFCYYQFCSDDQQNYIRLNAIQTGVPHTNLGILRSTPILLPPIAEQRAIAHILGTLDDKIELNRKQNETLEAMARTLFKAWFVDFEPVRAKLEGRWQRGQSLPGLPAHLYDFFPDRLVESELGEIPEGWRRSTIGAEVSIHGGSTPSTKEFGFWEDGRHCWATPKDLSALRFPVLLDTDRKITDAGLAKISSGLLPVGTVLLSSRAPIGYLAITEVPTAINQGFIAMKCNGTLPNVFVLQWCKENMNAIVGNANGSTFQEISKSNFRPIPIVVPSDPLLASFKKSADSLYKRLVENERESKFLAQIRDILLPKLISGDLRVPDVETLLRKRG